MRHPVQRSLLCGKFDCLMNVRPCFTHTWYSFLHSESLRWLTRSASKSQVRSAEMWRSRSARMCPSWLASGGTLLMIYSLLLDFLFHMVVCRKKPNTKCKSIPHQVCELVTFDSIMLKDLALSVAIPLDNRWRTLYVPSCPVRPAAQWSWTSVKSCRWPSAGGCF